MGKNDFFAEVGLNYEQKCLCVFVLDISESMQGMPMDVMNKCLQDFYSKFAINEAISSKMEVSIIAFNNLVKIIQEPSLIGNFEMPHLSATDYSGTAMEDAVNLAINLVEHRKEWFKMTKQVFYRPLIVLISSVESNSIHNIDLLAKRIKIDTAMKRYSFIPSRVDISSLTILNKIKGDYPPKYQRETVKYILSYFENLLDPEAPLITKEQNEPVDLSNLDWADHFNI